MEAIPGGSITLRKPVLASTSRGFLFILTMLLVSVTALSLSACQSSSSEDSLAAVKKGGKLVIATDDTYPPLEWNEDGEIVGFDIDLMTEICQRIGVKAEFESSKWDGLLTGLAGKQYDAVISTMNITPEREEQADFVEYAGWAQVIVTAPSNTSVSEPDDLQGKHIAVQVSTTSENIAKNIENAEVSSFESFDTTFMELKNQRVDAIIIDEPVAMYYQAKDPDAFAVAGTAQEKEPVGIALRKGSDSLKAGIEKALEDMKADGAYEEIFERWFGK
jgi:polar amino acid transport system substrate-binding protein